MDFVLVSVPFAPDAISQTFSTKRTSQKPTRPGSLTLVVVTTRSANNSIPSPSLYNGAPLFCRDDLSAAQHRFQRRTRSHQQATKHHQPSPDDSFFNLYIYIYVIFFFDKLGGLYCASRARVFCNQPSSPSQPFVCLVATDHSLLTASPHFYTHRPPPPPWRFLR